MCDIHYFQFSFSPNQRHFDEDVRKEQVELRKGCRCGQNFGRVRVSKKKLDDWYEMSSCPYLFTLSRTIPLLLHLYLSISPSLHMQVIQCIYVNVYIYIYNVYIKTCTHIWHHSPGHPLATLSDVILPFLSSQSSPFSQSNLI